MKINNTLPLLLLGIVFSGSLLFGIFVPSASAATPTASCTISPNPVSYNGSPTITLYQTNADWCQVRNDWNVLNSGNFASGSTYNPGVQTVGAHEGEVYCIDTVTNTGSNGGTWSTCSYTVSPPPQPTASCYISPNPVSYGGTPTLTLIQSYGTWCQIRNDWNIITSGGLSSWSTYNLGTQTAGAHEGEVYCVDQTTGLGSNNNTWATCPYTQSPAPVNGGWSAWSAQDPTCGYTGTQTRTCTNPAPAYGGANCVDSSTKSYTNQPCPINGTCGTANGITYPYGSSSYSPYEQCTSIYSWTCVVVGPTPLFPTPATCNQSNLGATYPQPYTDPSQAGCYCTATNVPSSTAFPVAGASSSWTCAGLGGWSSGTCTAAQAPAPINGGWTAWSATNNTCGFSGTQTRTCTSPAPAYGGAACVGASSQTYTNAACPVNGACSVTHYSCTAGISAGNAEASPNWTWTCNGANGGTNASCSQPIPTPTGQSSSCTTAGTGATVSWTLPSGYTLSYFRIIDNTTGTYPPSWIPENVSDTGPSTSFATTPGHNYTTWIHTRLPSGAYSSEVYTSFACAASCSLPWGGTIVNGTPVTAYSSPTVTSPATCASETRTCTNGTLSGSYTNQSCIVQTVGVCGTANGRLYANGSTSYAPYTQCATSGSPSTTTFPTAGNAISWTCSGTNGGAPSGTCSASQDIADYCGTGSSATPLSSEPTTGAAACGHGAYANSPADVTTNGAQAWRWSCGTATTCSAPKYGCTTTTDTNYNAIGPNNIYNCALTCANGAPVSTYSSCPLAPTASLSASPSPVAYNTRSTLTWSSSNATNCTAGGAWSNSGTLSGSGLSNQLTADTSFTFQCTGPGGATSPVQAVTVPVGAAAACSLPWGGTIANGVSATAYLTASVTSPTTCASESRTCNNGVLSGSYTNQSCSVMPFITFTATPSTIQRNHSTTITWSSSGATSCVAAGGFSTGDAPSGSVSVTPLTTSAYQITCTGPGGSSTATLAQTTVTVINPSVTITAAPVRTLSGSSSIITWSSVDALSCAVSGPGLSATGLSGSRTVSVNSQSVYTITCQTADSPVTGSVTVNVAPTFKEF